MGYTHYWRRTGALTETQMRDIASQVKLIIRTSGVPIRNYDGEGSPTLTKKEIAFNGAAPDDDHESFFIPLKPEDFEFCKTAHKPYDVVVTACLTLLAADYGFSVSSDGDVEDWDAGVTLAERALGRSFANPLIVRALVD
jgi:hypothetical protein